MEKMTSVDCSGAEPPQKTTTRRKKTKTAVKRGRATRMMRKKRMNFELLLGQRITETPLMRRDSCVKF